MRVVCLESEDDEEQKDAIEEEDRVRYKEALIGHFQTVLEKACRGERRPENNEDAECNASCVSQIAEDAAESQAAEGQERVAEDAHCRVELHVDAALRQQVYHEVDAYAAGRARRIDVPELVLSSLHRAKMAKQSLVSHADRR